MRKRIRIRRTIIVIAFAAVIGSAMVGPAMAYEATDTKGPQAQSCNLDARQLHSDPQTCSQPVFSNFTEEEPVTSSSSPSSSAFPVWSIYTTVGALILGVGAAVMIRRHPQLTA